MQVSLNAITNALVKNENGMTMGTEEYMIYCARVSSEVRKKCETAPNLMNYLINHGHWSPFEMVSIGIEIKTSRAIAQQMLRHRSFSFQEFSQRYAEVSNMEPVQLRYQADKNRQSSTDAVAPEDHIHDEVEAHILKGVALYERMISENVAKECARFVLPLTTETTIVMHGTLRSWIHFFDQRCSEHAQLEIQQIAYAAREEISQVCPWTAEALNWK